jgi:fluoride exporter
VNHFPVVFLGGGIGAALRHGVNRVAFHLWPAFPAGTMIVNIFGSLIVGLLVGIFAATPSLSQHTRLFLTTGVLGGFTTFSTFSLDALTLWERGAYGPWILYVGLSVVLSLLATAVGFLISRTF